MVCLPFSQWLYYHWGCDCARLTIFGLPGVVLYSFHMLPATIMPWAWRADGTPDLDLLLVSVGAFWALVNGMAGFWAEVWLAKRPRTPAA